MLKNVKLCYGHALLFPVTFECHVYKKMVNVVLNKIEHTGRYLDLAHANQRHVCFLSIKNWTLKAALRFCAMHAILYTNIETCLKRTQNMVAAND